MNIKFQRKLLAASLMALSAGAAVPTFAQSTGGSAMALEEIVVTARRRDETRRQRGRTLRERAQSVTPAFEKPQTLITKFRDLRRH